MDPFDLKLWKGFGPAGGFKAGSSIIQQLVIDSRRINSSNTLFVSLKGQHDDGHDFVEEAARKGVKFALVSQKWQAPPNLPPITLLRVEDPLRALQEIAQCYREHLPVKIIGITGSFGKTMVKDLLLALLQTQYLTTGSPESFNSQIGVPLSLLTIKHEHKFAIIEAAISQKEEMDTLSQLIQPDFTILTPIGKKHLATLETMDVLLSELSKLILSTHKSGWTLISKEFKIEIPHLKKIHYWDLVSKELPNAVRDSINHRNYTLSFPNCPSFNGTLPGSSNYYINLINICTKAAYLLGISFGNIINVLRQLREEPSRTELWSSPKGTHILNDSYCSDPQSMIRCLRFLNQSPLHCRRVFAFGGMRSQSSHLQQEYEHIGEILAHSNIKHLLLYGNHPFASLIESFQKHKPDGEIHSFPDEHTALSFLNNYVQANDLVFIKGERKIPFEHLFHAFNEGISNNLLIVNLSAIQANLSLIKKKLPSDTRIMAVIKAFAYGTGDSRMAKYLISCGVDILGVSYVDEGVCLRQAGISQPIFSINAAIYEVPKVVKWDLEVGVSDLALIQKLAEKAKEENKCIKIHLHVNTGMGRFGCRPEEALELAQFITSQAYLKLEGLMTHFACADDASHDPFTHSQITLFDSIIDLLKGHGINPPWKHASNSSAAIRFHLPHYNMVRIGLALYGLHASSTVEKTLELRLALSLTSRIVGINICHLGESVSYGRSYLVEHDNQRIAVLPIGYFDGFHRNYSGKASVLIAGQNAPMVGNICMDYMMVDVSNIPNIKVGDPVLIFGEDELGNYLSPENLAQSGNSIIHELITCLGPRIQRIFVFEEGQQQR